MKIQKNAVVAINYKLTDATGELLDESAGKPLAFIYGTGQIIPGLENALDGRAAGETFKVDILAKDAYGEKYDEMIQKVPRSSLQGVNDLKVGMQLEAQAEDQTVVVMVTEVTDEFVTVDGNHPLAGVDLTFDVEIVEVRAATSEELDHGHVHGEHGHQH